MNSKPVKILVSLSESPSKGHNPPYGTYHIKAFYEDSAEDLLLGTIDSYFGEKFALQCAAFFAKEYGEIPIEGNKRNHE